MSSTLLLRSDASAARRLSEALFNDGRYAVWSHATTLHEARVRLADSTPDLLIADMRLSDGALFELLATLRPTPRARAGRMLVLVVAASLHDPQLIHTLRMGADAFVAAGASNGTVLQVVRQTLAGESPIVAGVARQMLEHFDGLSARPVPVAGTDPQPALTPTERQLLEWSGAGYGVVDIAHGLQVRPREVGLRMRALFRRIQAERGAIAPAPPPTVTPPEAGSR